MGASGGDVRGARELIAALTAGAAALDGLLEVAVDGVATEVKTATQRNARGRPGPEDVTGDYVDSWRTGDARGHDPGEVSRSVYSTDPAAHRLEFGFVGTDELGRHVDAPPYPHLWPAVQASAPLFQAATAAAVEKAIKW